IEAVARRERTATTSAAPSAAFPAPFAADVDRLGFPAHGHHHAAFRVELDDHVRAFIHDPYVVLRIDPHGVRKQEPVQALTDLADVVSVGGELEQACAAMREHSRSAL